MTSAADVLELLALSEVIARALGVSKRAAWDDHARWIDAQSEPAARPGHEGLDPDEIARLRTRAGSPDS